MRWHVVGTFDRVKIVKVFWADVIDCGFQVLPHIRVSIFIQRQAGRSVLNKEVQNANFKQPD